MVQGRGASEGGDLVPSRSSRVGVVAQGSDLQSSQRGEGVYTIYKTIAQ